MAAVPDSPSSLFTSASLFEQPANSTNAYVDWVARVIAAHGGIMTSANLGSALAEEDKARYETIKACFGGLCGLLARHPDRFARLDNQPLNHVAVVRGPRPGPLARAPGDRGGLRRTASFSSDSSGGSARRGARRRPPPAPAAASRADEAAVVRETVAILDAAADRALTAVDLGNALRARVGVDALGRVRASHGGLLALLERHPRAVRVRRVPKRDVVELAPPRLDAWGDDGDALPATPPGDALPANPRGAAPAVTPERWESRADGLLSAAAPAFAPAAAAAPAPFAAPPLGSLFAAPAAPAAAPADLTRADYAPTRPWRRGPADDAAVAALRGELRNAPAPPTLNKARAALQRALRLTESVKTVPLRAFLDAYGDVRVFEVTVRRDRVFLL